MEANKISDFTALEIPKSLKAGLKVFCEELLRFFKEKIVSITIVGSAATTDFSGKVSDINILCVFSDLYLIDLRDALPMINKCCNKNRFSPRFIRKNDLVSSSSYFPIDLWTMKETRYLVFGEDILEAINLNRKDLVWHLFHEIKGLRIKAQQQFWRTAGNARLAKANLLKDFNTVICLLKVIFLLKDIPAPKTLGEIISKAKNEFKVETYFLEQMFFLRLNEAKITKKDIFNLFDSLLGLMRRLEEL